MSPPANPGNEMRGVIRLMPAYGRMLLARRPPADAATPPSSRFCGQSWQNLAWQNLMANLAWQISHLQMPRLRFDSRQHSTARQGSLLNKPL
jgi:hypothetical protein